MLTNITKSHRVECVEYVRSFQWADSPGCGFGFDCDENGEILRDRLAPEAIENLTKCLDGTFTVLDRGIETRSWSYRVHAVGRCECGRKVELAHFTNTCGCGRDYGPDGGLLAPRSQWGEETGEHLADILRIA